MNHEAIIIKLKIASLHFWSSLDLSSDHSPVIVTVGSKIQAVKQSEKLHSKKTKWSKFKEIVQLNLPPQIPLKSKLDIENGIDIYNSVIQDAGWRSTAAFETSAVTSKKPQTWLS